jgi:branched-chain amino acid transport system permease protein/neutral amino acid transport system permease protein
LDLLIASIGFGLITASIVALGAVGFTLQFGITNIFNLAYGEVMGASAFVAYQVYENTNNVLALWVVGAVFGALLSFTLNRVVIGPLIRKGTSPFGLVIVTLALGLILENLVLAIGGAQYFTLVVPPGDSFVIGPMIFTLSQLSIICAAVLVMLALHVVLTQTQLGRAMRATATNATLARTCGINVNHVKDIVWTLSGLLCGLAGVALVINIETFQASTAQVFVVVVIAGAILGGIGQPYGAMLGAGIIGLVTEVSAAYIGSGYKDVAAFVILVLVLLIRPQGIRGAIAAGRGLAS